MEAAEVQRVPLVTQNESMRGVLRKLDRIVESDASVLLIGETGVGKELLAEYIHRGSPRSSKPFVKVSLSSIPAELLESELFGHDRGAYTNAAEEKKGLFEIADGGSILLDDIDDVPIQMQSKLLRFIESRELMHVGGTTSKPVNVRFITASKVDLKGLVRQNIFRADLFYRLNVVPFSIPPLRDRREDIPILAQHFARMFRPAGEVVFSAAALRILVDYPWPGNVRELRNTIQRVVLFAGQEVKPGDLPVEVALGSHKPADGQISRCYECFVENSMNFREVISCLEHSLLDTALAKSDGNQITVKMRQSFAFLLAVFFAASFISASSSKNHHKVAVSGGDQCSDNSCPYAYDCGSCAVYDYLCMVGFDERR